MPVPEQNRPAPKRTPFYRNETDLIANGVGENTRGMYHAPDKQILIGH